MDMKNMGAKRVCVVTDETVDKLDAMRQVRDALAREGINFTVYNKTRIEPKDSSYVLHFPYGGCDPTMSLTSGPGSRRPSSGPSSRILTHSWLSEVARSSIQPN
jgi:hypothetical protein